MSPTRHQERTQEENMLDSSTSFKYHRISRSIGTIPPNKLAVIEKQLGKRIPPSMVSSAIKIHEPPIITNTQTQSKYRSPFFLQGQFDPNDNYKLNFPNDTSTPKTIKRIKNTQCLSEVILCESLLDLIYSCLRIDPKERISAKDAKKHQFFKMFGDKRGLNEIKRE